MQYAWRVPSCSVRPRSSSGRISGCFLASQSGGAAVGVPSTTLIPWSFMTSIARRIHSKSYWPSSRS